MKEITRSQMNNYAFKSFRKISFIRARQLTLKDFQYYQGSINTIEGKVSFNIGDFLACGYHNEQWPISKSYLDHHYQRVSAPDKKGFASYQARTIRTACQIHEPFRIKNACGDVMQGKAGDYLIRTPEDCWIVDQTIFEHTYQRFQENAGD
jgi:hypothetical protein